MSALTNGILSPKVLNHKTLSIGQLAKRANVSSRTLRYYEELGLVVPFERGENRYRYYDESHLSRLGTIKMLQEAGFSLKEIVAAFGPLVNSPIESTHQQGQELAKRIFDALKGQISKLEERKLEIARTVTELEGTLKRLGECFSCKSSKSLHDCAMCQCGPLEITLAGQRAAGQNSPKSEKSSAQQKDYPS